MKIYFYFLYLFFSISAIGQNQSISINYKPSLTYFGRQSQNFDMRYPTFFSTRNDNITFSNSVNILYSCKLSSKIKITSGLEYSQQGQNIRFNTDSIFPNNKALLKIELNYLRIPLTIEYSIFKIKKSELNIHTGLSLGIVTKRKDNYQDILTQEYNLIVPALGVRSVLLQPASKRYKNQDWAIPIGVNYHRALAKNKFVIFGVEYLIGLTNSFTKNGNAEYIGALSDFDNSKQKRLSLNIGIGFNLAK